MKAVRTQGGTYALPFRVEYLLDRVDLVAALAWNYREEPFDIDDADEVLIDLTQRAARELVIEAIREAGTRGYLYWADGLSELWEEKLRAWAQRQVRRCFATAFIRGGSPPEEWGEPLIDALAPEEDTT